MSPMRKPAAAGSPSCSTAAPGSATACSCARPSRRGEARSDDALLRALAELAAALAPIDGAPPGNHGAGRAPSSRRRARPGPAPRSTASPLAWRPGRLPVGGRRGGRAGHGIALEPALHGLSAGARRKPRLRRRAPDPARPDRRPARARRARAAVAATAARALDVPTRRHRQRDASAPTIAACGTRPNTRGCFGASE